MTDVVPVKNKGGRPPKLRVSEDLEFQIYEMAKLFLTLPQMSTLLRVDRKHLAKLLEDPKLQAAYERGRGEVKEKLLKKQVDLALEGSVTMLIWLGKNYLDQTDQFQPANQTAVQVVINGIAADL